MKDIDKKLLIRNVYSLIFKTNYTDYHEFVSVENYTNFALSR